MLTTVQGVTRTAGKINLDDVDDGAEDADKSDGEKSDVGSQLDEDYDVDEEFDNDYAENYFDNGEGDEGDDAGGGIGGGEDGGGHSLSLLHRYVGLITFYHRTGRLRLSALQTTSTCRGEVERGQHAN